MIVDLILDRKDGVEYHAPDFYRNCVCYGDVGEEITRAMDLGTEEDVKKALCQYIDDQEYNPEIKKYIMSVEWLTGHERY